MEITNPQSDAPPLPSTALIPECLESDGRLAKEVHEDDHQQTERAQEDPHQLALQRMAETRMIAPTSSFRGNWDLVQAFLLMYIAVSLPYRLGFDDNVVLWSFAFFFDLCVDIYFIADLCLNFRTAVITAEGELLYRPRDVAKAYLRGWFVIDFLSCLPLSYAEYTMDDGSESASRNKAVRLMRLFRLLKLLRLVRIKRILDRWEEEMYGVRALRIGKLIFIVLAISHWMASGWYFCGVSEPRIGPDGRTMSQGWALDMWSNHSEYPPGRLEKYFTSYFWASMSTLMVDTTSAVPDSSPETWEEKVMYVMSFSMGTLIVSIIIGQVSDMIAHANPGEKHQSDLIGMVHGMLHERKVSAVLTRKIRSHFSNVYKMRGTTLDLWQDVFTMMPTAMADELATELGFLDNSKKKRGGILTNVPFLDNLPTKDIVLIGCRLQHLRVTVHGAGKTTDPDVLSQRNVIMRQGERDDRMFIIIEGIVRVTRRRQDDTLRSSSTGAVVQGAGEELSLGRLHELDYFGEMAVLLQESPGVALQRQRSAYTVTGACILYTLSYDDLQELRALSAPIDAAVATAAAAVQTNRPSLTSEAPTRTEVVSGGGVGASSSSLEERMSRLETKMDTLIGMVAEAVPQMMAES